MANFKQLSIALSFLLVLATPLHVFAYGGPPWYRVEATPAQEKFAKETISREMKDPSSTQLRDVYATSRGLGDDTVCGEVNAKNSFGAYVGFRSFVVNSDGSYYVSEPGTAMASFPELVCNKPPKP